MIFTYLTHILHMRHASYIRARTYDKARHHGLYGGAAKALRIPGAGGGDPPLRRGEPRRRSRDRSFAAI